MRWMIALLALVALIGIAPTASASLTSAQMIMSNGSVIVDSAGLSTSSILYEASKFGYSDPTPGVTPDITIQVCATDSADLSGKYGSAIYRVRNDGKIIGKLPTSGGYALEPFNTTFSIGDGYCANLTMNWNFVASKAVYPGRLYAVVSNDTTLDLPGDSFVYMPAANGWLNGYYTINDLVNAYDQVSGNLTNVQVTEAYGGYNGASLAYTAVSGDNANSLMVGVCTVSGGIEQYSCTSSTNTNRDTNFNLDTGTTYASYGYASSPTNKKLLINGLDYGFCMGPDLYISDLSLPAGPYYSGQNVTINATVKNKGNVNVTSSFNVTFFDGVSQIGTPQSIASMGSKDSQSSTVSVTWSIPYSGSHTITASVDYEGKISECNETNQNATTAVDVAKTYYAQVWIDGVETTNFTVASRPYNVTLKVWDTDDNYIPNATVILYELNDISLFAPMQAWNDTGSNKRGLVPISAAQVVTESDGTVSFALSPTGNKLYSTQPAIKDYVGNHSMYLEIYVDGARQKIYWDGAVRDNEPLKLNNLNPTTPNAQVSVINQGWVETFMTLAYQVYSNIIKWLTFT